jgi:hypothetical protein
LGGDCRRWLHLFGLLKKSWVQSVMKEIKLTEAQIVADCDAKEAAIAACTTVDKLMAVVAPVNTKPVIV